MQHLRVGTFLSCLLLALGATRTARAGSSFEFLFNADVPVDDGQLFLRLAVQDSGFGRGVLTPVLPRIANVQADLPVVLFLAQRSSTPVEVIVQERSRGLSWASLFAQHRVPADTLFVGMDRDPGPPYGRAWGYWRNHPRETRFEDDEIRGLVEVQLGARASGLTPLEVARVRGQGQTVAFLVAEHKGRHGRGGREGSDRGNKGKKRGHEKDRDSGEDHDPN